MISLNKPCCVHKRQRCRGKGSRKNQLVAETILKEKRESQKFLNAYSIRIIEVKRLIKYTVKAAVCCKSFDLEIKTWDLKKQN